jgi:hypothetical protein
MNLTQYGRTSTGVVPIRICILGPSGWGKSYMAAALCKLLTPADSLYVVGPMPNVKLEMEKMYKTKDIRWYNIPIPAKDRVAAEKFFQHMSDSDEHWMMCLDEADLYMASGSYGTPSIRVIVNTGRGSGHGIVCIARGSNEIAKNLLGTCDLVLFGRVTEPNAIDYLRRYVKHAIPDIEDVIQKLQPHTFLAFCPQSDPQFAGFVSVVNGQIVTYEPPEESWNEESLETQNTDETQTTGEDASIPPADAGSSADTPVTTAVPTTQSTSGPLQPKGNANAGTG